MNSEILRWVLRGLFPMWPAGSSHAVDVRTVADTVLAVLAPGAGPRRYVVPGVAMDADLLFGTLQQVTGRRLPHDTPARSELGVVPVSFEDSLRDTTRWLVEAGRLPAKYAGRAAPTR